MQQFRGGKSGTYKIKTVLFLFTLGLLAAANKNIIEKKRETYKYYILGWFK